MTDSEQRLLRNSVMAPDSDCWLWIGKSKSRRGGARDGAINFREQGRHVTRAAHRISYEQFVAPIPEGHEVDHTCRDPMCINPAHLEAVTPEENRRRRVYS